MMLLSEEKTFARRTVNYQQTESVRVHWAIDFLPYVPS